MKVVLNVKTDYSLFKSIIKVKDLINFCKNNEVSICGICDDNLYSSIEFYKLCKSNNIKPIIGLEINYQDIKLYLYAKNYEGYKNLLKLNTIKNELDVMGEELKNYVEGVICILPYKYIKSYEEVVNIYNGVYISYENSFEKKNASTITDKIIYLNTIRCFKSDDLKYLELFKNLGNEEYEVKNSYINDDYDSENEKLLEFCGGINLEIPTNERYIPKYKSDINSYEYLSKLAYMGLKKRCHGSVSEEYLKRLNKELNVIKEMGFVDYFLIVYDYVLYAKKNKILVGPGRGSAAGSLVSYSIGITDIDPIKYDLLFERFLNKNRVSMPDIDIDFDNTKRDEVIDYVKNKYGHLCVAGGLTYATYKTRLILRELLKYYQVDERIANKFLSVMGRDLSLRDNLKNDKVNKYLSTYPELKEIYDNALHLEGLKKNFSTHAAGIVIGDQPLDNLIPMYKNEDVYLCGVPMEYLENLGLLKMDFLALKNLSIISNIINKIPDFDLSSIDLEDKLVYELFKNAKTDGVFQFETNSFKSVLPSLMPKCFNDLIAAVALVRPGPSKELNSYINRKDGHEKITYYHEDLKPILEDTYGIIIYQEQVIQILNKMAKFDNAKSDDIRRAMSKKKSDLLNKYQEEFIKCSVNNGYSESVSKTVYDHILEFAGYGFNKAHSVSYALVSYQMAYLKVHYHPYFIFELLNDNLGSIYKMKIYLNELKSGGVKLVKPALNFSHDNFHIQNNYLYLPFKLIKGLGTETVKLISEEQKEGKFESIYDVFRRFSGVLNKKVFIILIASDVFKEFKYNQNTLMNNLDSLLNYGELSKDIPGMLKPNIVRYPEYDKDILRMNELNSYGFYISNHPSSKYMDNTIMKIENMNKFLFKNIRVAVIIEEIKRIKTKKNEDMAFLVVSDETGSADVTVFTSDFNKLNNINKNDFVIISGNVTKRLDKVSIVLKNVVKELD